jgi:Spy/CpxP family protein refolding chaperone
MTSTRWTYRFAAGLALLGSAALSGCAAGAASGPVPATAASSIAVDDDDLTADLNEHHRHHPQGGVTMFIALSLDTLGLPPEQQAVITKIQADLFARMEPARAAGQKVLMALADGIAAGAIDEPRVDAAIAELASASGLVHDATVDALSQLHAALTPPERAALVDKVAANWAVFRQANDEDGKDRRAGHLSELAVDLGLSDDQVDRIGASFHTAMRAAGALDPAEIDAYLERLGAFRGDGFDPRTLSGGAAANAHVAARGATRMARFYEAVTPVLTPEQRAKLVVLLREHAAHKDEAFIAAH